jgi:hypothetical protein
MEDVPSVKESEIVSTVVYVWALQREEHWFMEMRKSHGKHLLSEVQRFELADGKSRHLKRNKKYGGSNDVVGKLNCNVLCCCLDSSQP